MMRSLISFNIWIVEQHALQGASYLQSKSCARGHVGFAVPVAIACLRASKSSVAPDIQIVRRARHPNHPSRQTSKSSAVPDRPPCQTSKSSAASDTQVIRRVWTSKSSTVSDIQAVYRARHPSLCRARHSNCLSCQTSKSSFTSDIQAKDDLNAIQAVLSHPDMSEESALCPIIPSIHKDDEEDISSGESVLTFPTKSPKFKVASSQFINFNATFSGSMPFMMMNAQTLEEQFAILAKAFELLTKTIEDRDAQIATLLSKLEGKEDAETINAHKGKKKEVSEGETSNANEGQNKEVPEGEDSNKKTEPKNAF
ncbi:hypothetical protein RJ639_044859 [Escallonia herrerae]|uniref:Uncharacterized protein n=1 Tax=Escallonia herrerae TaxID=1293975 RepID=A0AA88WCD0_9ASTE|nr:hypothetical protein RJ639_044859 [Escallonia herrerae]